MRPRTICFFGGDVTRCGGTERASTMLSSLLHRQGRYRVILLSLVEREREPFFPLDEDIPHYRLGDAWIPPGPGYLKLLPRLRKFLREQDIDVVIDVDIVLDALSVPAAMGLKTRVVSWEHFNCHFEESVLYRRLILHCLVRRSDYVVTLTERDREQYLQWLGHRQRIRAIRDPVEPPVLTPGVKKEKWVITVGRLVPEKGPEKLLEVARRVLKRHPDWRWLLLGEGESRQFLEKGIRDGQLEDRLLLMGGVRNVSDYLQRAQIYVMTSLYEGLGICLLEAKAHRLPCVAFDVPTGPGELIADGVNGCLIPAFDWVGMAEMISRLIEDPALRERFADRAGLGMERCRPDHVLAQWDQVIEEVCPSGKEAEDGDANGICHHPSLPGGTVFR